MSVLVNLHSLDINEKDIKVLISYLSIDQGPNTELIKKVLKLGKYLKMEREKNQNKKEKRVLATFKICSNTEIVEEESGYYTISQFLKRLDEVNLHNIDVWCIKKMEKEVEIRKK